MTTNHRPTLESKRGKRITIKDSISHSRNQPQQKSLKYRNDIPIPNDILSNAVKQLKEEEEEVEEPEKKKIKLEETKEEVKEESECESESESDSEDDETAELLAEIEKIRNEKKQEEDKIKSNNPLVKIDNKQLQKKSWRSSTFREKKQPSNESPKFTNDTLKSDYHQKLLSKVFK
ncbi:unnamed protein product [Candida verbasci]|uniref:Pre-mRNA-splicing factor CWC15 n=1 Tax=Candida verbasci TaxID=1227364 RepID=A0A9W4TQM6_9ASCO|nr:unnamed protein product [Candida verbasci]